VNPHAVSAFLGVTRTRQIIVTRDIVAEDGSKVWQRHQPLASATQRHFVSRALKQPLEACLGVEDGVSTSDLAREVERLLSSGGALAAGVRPWSRDIVAHVKALPLHSAAQLLLTTTESLDADSLAHAVQAMVLSGAMALSVGASRDDVSLALLGGLLHDIGELYVDPCFRQLRSTVTPESYRDLVDHPRIAQRLIAGLMDYPPALARAVGEHHERCDGSGYPGRAASSELSLLGQRLGAVEFMAEQLRAGRPSPWSRVCLGLSLVPGEFDIGSLAFARRAARAAGETPGAMEADSARGVRLERQRIVARIDAGLQMAWQLVRLSSSAQVCTCAANVVNLLERLAVASGGCGHRLAWEEGSHGGDLFDLLAGNEALSERLDVLQRTAAWGGEERLTAADEQELAPLWACIEASRVRYLHT
jgi:hypothetical protein